MYSHRGIRRIRNAFIIIHTGQTDSLEVPTYWADWLSWGFYILGRLTLLRSLHTGQTDSLDVSFVWPVVLPGNSRDGAQTASAKSLKWAGLVPAEVQAVIETSAEWVPHALVRTLADSGITGDEHFVVLTGMIFVLQTKARSKRRQSGEEWEHSFSKDKLMAASSTS